MAAELLSLACSQEAGLPVGGSDFNGYVMLEVHYNNPELRKGKWECFFFCILRKRDRSID